MCVRRTMGDIFMKQHRRHVQFVLFNIVYVVVTMIAFAMLSGISRIGVEQSDRYFKNFYDVEVQRVENGTVERSFRWSAQDGVIYLIRQPNDNGFNILSFMATTVVNNQSVAIEINQERMAEFDVEAQLFRKYQSLVHLQWQPLNIGNAINTIHLKNSAIVSVAGRNIALAISDVVVTPITGTKYPDGIVMVVLILMVMMGTWVYFQFSSNVFMVVYSVCAVVLIGIWQAVVMGSWQAGVLFVLTYSQYFVVLMIALVVFCLYYSFDTIHRLASYVGTKVAQRFKIVQLSIAPKYARVRWLWEVRYVVQKNWVLTTMPWIIASLSLAYISWQLIGIRFHNEDDIAFHLFSYLYGGDYFSLPVKTAFNQNRVQAVLNWSLFMWANGFQRSWFFDVIHVLDTVCLLLSMVYFFSKLIGRKSAVLLVSFPVIVFPMHLYATFPQGYLGWGDIYLTFGLLSAGLLASHLRNPRNWKFVGSVILFTVSLMNFEFYFLLFPLFLGFIYYFAEDRKDYKGLISLSWPYALGWLAYLVVYVVFLVFSRNQLTSINVGRVAF